MISRTQSAPSIRDSATCHGSSRKSLRSAGRGTAARAAARYVSRPWKNGSSVSTDRQAAPPAA